MKIPIEDAFYFVKHLEGLNKLAGNTVTHDVGIYRQLSRMERRTNHICAQYYNGDMDISTHDKEIQNMLVKLKTLLPNAKTLYIDTDPRGAHLRIKAEEANQNSIWVGWSGDGVLVHY